MAGTERRVWTILEIIGIIVLLIGATRYIGVPSSLPDIGEVPSLIIVAIGLILIIESSIFIALEGVRLNREIEEFEKAKEEAEIAAAADAEPERVAVSNQNAADDSNEPYVLDIAADPTLAAQYLNESAVAEEPVIESDVREEETVWHVNDADSDIDEIEEEERTENVEQPVIVAAAEPVSEEPIERLRPAVKPVEEPVADDEEEWIEEPSNDDDEFI
ncbi:MAG: hypothetical protein LBM39_01475 [Candidatus Methanoplasma sp.]|jgi:hypothetical protein|nr:hypothetical protein [Candidatus Methanoplasma sp.]